MEIKKKFDDHLNTAVITTKFVLLQNSPILFVSHFEDGFWQFSGTEVDIIDEDYRLISLEEIINIDHTIIEIADLPPGCDAFRENINSKWVRN